MTYLDPCYKPYKKRTIQWMRPHIVGEEMSEISVSDKDIEKLKKPGGMIAVNINDPRDRWYVSKDFFEANYELL